MHKILIQTELVRLRQLGFEVFCPAYSKSSAQHQSAASGWTQDQATTLPPQVFETLSAHNFFYQEISPQIGSLLNQYFDAVVVTIDPAWLIEVLRGYHGKIIYRTFGHVKNMSHFLFEKNAMPAIMERDDFWYLPHSLESALHEHSWLRERMSVVPYCVTADVLPILDQWAPRRNEIMVSCPNIANSYFQKHFEFLKEHFSDPPYRFYGVQTTENRDPQLVGTIPFEQLMKAYSESAGFLYTYREPTVCFLPPIEMMIAGGPVIFLQGSLLDQYFLESAPGRARNEQEARSKCEKLLPASAQYDPQFAQEVIQSQRNVRARYLPRDVWPVFDQVFLELLDPSVKNKGQPLLKKEQGKKNMAIDAYSKNIFISFERGIYSSLDFDIDQLKNICQQLSTANTCLLLLCSLEQIPFWQGILGFQNKVTFFPVDHSWTTKIDPILYSADSPHGRLFFALTHPTWLLLKIRTLGHIWKKRISQKYKSFGNSKKDHLQSLLQIASTVDEILIFSDDQIVFYEGSSISKDRIKKIQDKFPR